MDCQYDNGFPLEILIRMHTLIVNAVSHVWSNLKNRIYYLAKINSIFNQRLNKTLIHVSMWFFKNCARFGIIEFFVVTCPLTI